MKFEEQFPKLNVKYQQKIHHIGGSKEIRKYYLEVDIQENCLDKAKVKEAIDKTKNRGIRLDGKRTIQDTIKKELGLEND